MREPRYDPEKDARNRAKHGYSLAFGDRIFDDPAHLIVPSIRPQDGEERFKVIGIVDGKFHTAVFVWRGAGPRFISVRRSNNGEEKSYRASG
ncbi:MAG: BrnT family toxin [Rhizobiaceae bacterium]|nr:BrnT family toxin [Rhizobiaceae bacterium]MCV0407120.1 BrnT family toxin [Rhizobiaceae bacterium]